MIQLRIYTFLILFLFLPNQVDLSNNSTLRNQSSNSTSTSSNSIKQKENAAEVEIIDFEQSVSHNLNLITKTDFNFGHHLTHLAIVELQIYKIFDEFRNLFLESSTIKLANFIPTYLNDYEQSSFIIVHHYYSETSIEWANIISGHPILAFRMIRRFVLDIPLLEFLLKETNYQDSFEGIVKLRTDLTWTWPTMADLENVMGLILRIQFVYNSDIISLSEGHILDIPFQVGVTSLQAFEIGQFAFKQKYYTLALSWIFLLKERVAHGLAGDIDESLLNEIAENIIREHDQEFDENLKTFNNIHMFSIKLSQSESGWPLSFLQHGIQHYKGSRIEDYELFDYLALCSYDNFQTLREKSNLICWNERSIHPYWVLNPMKIEAYSWDPIILRIFDLISQKEINQILEGQGDTGLDKKISKKIELVTGLKVVEKNASEPLHVFSFGFGEDLRVRNDFDFTSLKPQPEHRISTIIAYLNDNDDGYLGNTVFPRIGLSIVPIKGSAIFMFNTLRNGLRDGRVVYGTCPNVFGKSYLISKWILAGPNFQNQNCDISPFI